MFQNACEKIMKRLEPYVNRNPNAEWEDWVTAAYLDRVSLSATGSFWLVVCPFAYHVNG